MSKICPCCYVYQKVACKKKANKKRQKRSEKQSAESQRQAKMKNNFLLLAIKKKNKLSKIFKLVGKGSN